MNYFIKQEDLHGKTHIKITFELNGRHLNFDDITEKMKLTPTMTRNYEDFPEVSKKCGAARDIWLYSSCYNESMLIAEEIEKFLPQLSDKIDIINELKQVYNITSMFIISIQAYDNPYPLIPMSCIEFAYKTNTEIEFAPYYY
jgi:hypothetical protein